MHHTDALWNGIWSDLFIESTYMRYGHDPYGIIGSTLSETILDVWALSHNTMGQMANDVAELDNHQYHVVICQHRLPSNSTADERTFKQRCGKGLEMPHRHILTPSNMDGCMVTGNVLYVVRLPQGRDIAPPAVLNLVSCNCNKCSSSQCIISLALRSASAWVEQPG